MGGAHSLEWEGVGNLDTLTLFLVIPIRGSIQCCHSRTNLIWHDRPFIKGEIYKEDLSYALLQFSLVMDQKEKVGRKKKKHKLQSKKQNKGMKEIKRRVLARERGTGGGG